jgi:hypothetical protein
MQSCTSLISYPHSKIFQDAYKTGYTSSQVYPNPMRVSYHANGTGRDTYINVHSGGFFKPYAPVAAAPVGSFSMKKIPNASPSPVIHAKPHHYRSDGSGRDYYIGINEGGLAHQPSFVEAKARFVASLR